MRLDNFKLERYFAQYEFKTKYLFSSSDCDGYALKYVLDHASTEELNVWHSLQLGYTESQGNPRLRESISHLYQTMKLENIMVSSPGEANYILMNILLKPTDHVVCMSPSYQSLYQVVKSLGCELSFWKPKNESWYFDPMQLEHLVKENTKLIIINFPHNPTGAFLNTEALQKIVSIARKHDIYLFSDEMYHLLTLNNVTELPYICDIYEKGISLWGMAKTFGLAGLRIGWLACQDKLLLEKILSHKDYLSICNSAPSEILAWIAINHKQDFIVPNLKKIHKNIQYLKNFQSDHPDFIDFISPRAGSTCFAKIKIPESTLEFCQVLVEKTGIMMVPSEIFEYGSGFIRIGFGRENFPEILNRLDKYIRKNYHQ